MYLCQLLEYVQIRKKNDKRDIGRTTSTSVGMKLFNNVEKVGNYIISRCYDIDKDKSRVDEFVVKLTRLGVFLGADNVDEDSKLRNVATLDFNYVSDYDAEHEVRRTIEILCYKLEVE